MDSKSHIPALTGLRGLAALSVLVFHLHQFLHGPQWSLGIGAFQYPVHAWAAVGYLGVDLFFVLSGFLLAQPFLLWAMGQREWPNLSRYVMHRVRRVVPALWAQIAMLSLVAWMGWQASFDVRSALLHATFLQHLFAKVDAINPVYWTLPVEWWFYFTVPLLGLAFRYARWWLWLLATLVFVFWFRLKCHDWLWNNQWQPGFNYANIMHLRARFDQFFLGALAAWFHLRLSNQHWTRRWLPALSLLVLIAWAPGLAARGDIFVKADYPYVLLHYTLTGAIMAALVYGVAAPSVWLSRLFAHRIAVWLGLISYSIYLWHYPVLEWTRRAGWFQQAGDWPGALLAIAATLLVSQLSWRFIERPFQANPSAVPSKANLKTDSVDTA